MWMPRTRAALKEAIERPGPWESGPAWAPRRKAEESWSRSLDSGSGRPVLLDADALNLFPWDTGRPCGAWARAGMWS